MAFDPVDLRHQRTVDVVFAAYSENPSREERGVRGRFVDAAKRVFDDRDAGAAW